VASTPKKPAKVAKKAAAKLGRSVSTSSPDEVKLLSGGNPQIAKGYGESSSVTG
jgi:hypothetical protein